MERLSPHDLLHGGRRSMFLLSEVFFWKTVAHKKKRRMRRALNLQYILLLVCHFDVIADGLCH